MKTFDIIDRIEAFANENGFLFFLGVKATLNLVDNLVDTDDVIIMVDANIEGIQTFDGFSAPSENLTINVFVLRRANFDQLVGNENGFETSAGKWRENIIGLRPIARNLINYIRRACDVEITQAAWMPVFNLFDLNTDGIALKINANK